MTNNHIYELNDILKEFSSSPAQKAEHSAQTRRISPAAPKREPESQPRPAPAKPAEIRRVQPAGKRRRGKGKGILIAAAAAVLLLAASGILVTNSKKIYPNVCIAEIPVGGMTVSRAEETLSAAGWEERTAPLSVETYAGITVDVSPVNAGILLDKNAAAEAAYWYGRGGNIFSNLRKFLSSLSKSVDVNGLSSSLNRSYISGKVAELESELKAAFGEESYFVDTQSANLVFVKSNGILNLNADDLFEKIVSALNSGSERIEYEIEAGRPQKPDFQRIYASVCTEPQNAYFPGDGTQSLVPEKPGYRFDIAEAEKLWEQALPGESVLIPLEILPAEVSAELLESLMFHDLLGAVTTKYNNSNENRSSNVRLASSKIDGVVLYPGEEFSFNAIVGERTEEAGFLMAPAYAGYGDIKDEIGGGVCQVSTGVYAAALFSFLKISSHTCHIYPPNYIQLGMDATVSIPEAGRTIDLKIVNDKACPIKIVSYCTETTDAGSGKPRKSVTVEIWGTLEPDDYMPVEFDNSYIDIYDYDRIIELAYPDREGYKIKFTHEENEFEDDYGKGLRTATHRKVYDSRGNLVEDRIINPTYSDGYALDTYYYRG